MSASIESYGVLTLLKIISFKDYTEKQILILCYDRYIKILYYYMLYLKMFNILSTHRNI